MYCWKCFETFFVIPLFLEIVRPFLFFRLADWEWDMDRPRRWTRFAFLMKFKRKIQNRPYPPLIWRFRNICIFESFEWNWSFHRWGVCMADCLVLIMLFKSDHLPRIPFKACFLSFLLILLTIRPQSPSFLSCRHSATCRLTRVFVVWTITCWPAATWPVTSCRWPTYRPLRNSTPVE